jgi:hypothetical protein
MTIKEEIALINRQTKQIEEINQDFDNEDKLVKYVEILNHLNKALELIEEVEYPLEEIDDFKAIVSTMRTDTNEQLDLVKEEVKAWQYEREEENPFEEDESEDR